MPSFVFQYTFPPHKKQRQGRRQSRLYVKYPSPILQVCRALQQKQVCCVRCRSRRSSGHLTFRLFHICRPSAQSCQRFPAGHTLPQPLIGGFIRMPAPAQIPRNNQRYGLHCFSIPADFHNISGRQIPRADGNTGGSKEMNVVALTELHSIMIPKILFHFCHCYRAAALIKRACWF